MVIIQSWKLEADKMTYAEKDFTKLIGTPGFSNKLLETHFKLYSGYVTNTNKALELLKI